ncbi:MAG: flavin reductase [Bacilli bacterium]
MRDKILSGVSIVAYEKNNIKYGMTCAWFMPCDYDQILLLLGSQSDTGNNLCVGDKIGISCLASSQKDIGLHFGEEHSKTFNKFENVSFNNNDGALLINGAKSQFVCEVLDIRYLKGNDEDHLVQVKILKETISKDLNFLEMCSM